MIPPKHSRKLPQYQVMHVCRVFHAAAIIATVVITSTQTPRQLLLGTSTSHHKYAGRLTVRFLVSRTGAGTAELLGLASPVVGDEQGAVVLDEGLLQLVLLELIDVFLVVGDDGLGDGLADGVDLAGVAAAGDAHADVDFGEAVEAEDEEGLVDLDLAYLLELLSFGSLDFLRMDGLLKAGFGGSCSTLKRRISGWTRLRGLPLTLTRPFPFCKSR